MLETGKSNKHDGTATQTDQVPKNISHVGICTKKNRVPAVPPASVVEQKFREAYLQGHQTAQRGKTERGRAGAEASAHECVTNFTRRFQDFRRWSRTCAVKHFPATPTPISETHYHPGIAELHCNHPLMCLLRSSTRAEKASAVRFLFLFRRILQVRVILQILSRRVPKRT